MDTYRELSIGVPKEYEAMRTAAHRFAKEVMRPAAIELDRMADPKDVIAPNSLLRQVLKKAYGLGYHVAGMPVAIGGAGLGPPGRPHPPQGLPGGAGWLVDTARG